LGHLGYKDYKACLVILVLQALGSLVSRDKQDLKVNREQRVSKVVLELLGHKVKLGLKA